MSDKQATNHCPLCEGYTKRIAELEADLENCVLAKRQAENAVARFTAEGSNLRKRITQLEAERDALKAELDAACTVTFEETEMGECHGEERAVPFEDVESAYREGYKDGFRDADFDPYNRALLGYEGAEQVGWEHSNAKARLDERRKEGDKG